MGVPAEDYGQLKRWCGYRAALSWGRPAPDDQVEIARNIADYRRYLRELVEAKAGAPGDDLTSGCWKTPTAGTRWRTTRA